MDSRRLFYPLVGSSLALVALLLGVVGFAAIRAIGDQDRSDHLVTRTYIIKETTTELVADLRASRAAQRNYVQNGGIEHLLEFQTLRSGIAVKLEGLWSIPHDPTQLGRIQRFTQLLAELYADYRAIVVLMADGDVESAEREMNNSRGTGQTSLLTRMADEIAVAEGERLAINVAKTGQANAEAKILVFTGLTLSLLVIATSALFIFRDRRRRLAIERALRGNSALLQDTLNFQEALVDSAAYGIIAADADGKITEFNRTAEQMLGYKAFEMIGKTTVAQLHDATELTERAAELSGQIGRVVAPGFDVLASVPRLGQVEEREWTYIHKDGRRIPVHVSMTAIRSDGARIKGYLGIARDITEMRKIARLKSEFVSTVSHELRTPLTSIRGSLGLVLGTFGTGLSAQVRGLLQIAHNNADRLGRLVNDILDVEKIESGKMEFGLLRQPLAPLLQQALESTQDFARQFNVTFQLRDEAPGAEVEVDGDRFIQVMVNLLSNAAKFSPAGEAVTVMAVRHGRTIRVSVTDKGKGIPVEFQDRIFERFAQADSSDSRRKSGTGLGLNIAKALVEKMNGLIGFDTLDDVGTTFHVDLPEMRSARVAGRPLTWERGLRSAS